MDFFFPYFRPDLHLVGEGPRLVFPLSFLAEVAIFSSLLRPDLHLETIIIIVLESQVDPLSRTCPLSLYDCNQHAETHLNIKFCMVEVNKHSFSMTESNAAPSNPSGMTGRQQ